MMHTLTSLTINLISAFSTKINYNNIMNAKSLKRQPIRGMLRINIFLNRVFIWEYLLSLLTPLLYLLKKLS